MRLSAITASLALAAGLLAGGIGGGPAQAAEAQATKPRPLVTGWFGWWASDPTIDLMIREADGVVGEVNMFWWTFQGKGDPLCVYDNEDYDGDGAWGDCLRSTSTPWTTDKFDRQRRMLQAAGIRVQASITDVGSATARQLTEYLATPQRRQKYADLIARYAEKAGVDGVDLDWENFAFNDGRETWNATKGRWVDMVKKLGAALHAKGLTLSATVPGGVPPFSSDGSANPGTGYWVYAWDEIIDHVDRLIIMTYDYSWDIPGPIGPNDWAREVGRSAVAQVGRGNAEKIWLGSPQYGRSWPLKSGSKWITEDGCPSNWVPTETLGRQVYSPAEAEELAAGVGVEPVWHEDAGEWSFAFFEPTEGKVGKRKRTCGVKRELWYGDTRSALKRAEAVTDVRIGGIAVWEFGDVEADFYQRLAQYGRSVAPAQTKVKVTAPPEATYGAATKVKVVTESSNGASAGERATLYWEPLSRGQRRSVQTITLDKDGKGTFTPKAERSGTWTVEVTGSWSRSEGVSRPAKTRVRFSVKAEASTLRPIAGDVVTLTATIGPALPEVGAQVQRQGKDGTWSTIKEVDVPGGGVVTVDVRPTMAGDVSYRIVVPAVGHYLAGQSSVLTLDVSKASGSVRTLSW
ncbi:MAG: glycosyl hydrolase family 18 protein [bacterium]